MEHRDIGAEIRRRLPEFTDLVTDAQSEQLAWVAQVISARNLPDAVHVIACQSVNDLTDLLSDCLDGSGRAAMRAARSLFEHGVNAYSVLRDATQPERYMAHLSQGPMLLADLDPGADLLTGSASKAYRHRVATRARNASREFESAVATYGPSFGRTWTPATLKDRADACGMGELYGFYKLGSLVAHGSAGGSIGTRRQHHARGADAGSHHYVTYRTGKALELCPVALWAGVLSHLHVMQAVEEAYPTISASEWSQPLLLMLGSWSSYQKETAVLDDELWPRDPQLGPQAVMAFTRTGRRRWFLHLPSHGLLIEAESPQNLEAEATDKLQRLVESQIGQDPSLFSNTQRWLTVGVPGAELAPKANGRVLPDTSLLTMPVPHLTETPFQRD